MVGVRAAGPSATHSSVMNRIRSFVCLAAGVLAACGGAGVPAPAPAPAAAPADPCVAGSSSHPDAADTLVVAAPGTVAPRDVPVPRSAAERFAFAQVYQTLVRVDCEGRIAPGLAERWQADRAARTWTFFLRPDATFADGLPVSAADVVVSWEARAVPGPWAGGRDAALEAIGPHALMVRLDAALDSVPARFADPVYAVVRAADAGGWPLGSGAFTLAGDGDSTLLIPVARPTWPRLRIVPLGDARDAVDHGAALVFTRDLGALSYARSRGGYTDLPLPWDTVYALAAPAGWSGTPRDAELVEAVHVDARPGTAPDWWGDLLACLPDSGAAPAAGAARPTGVISYAMGDGIARDLAARLVALAPSGGTTRALDRDTMHDALGRGDGEAFVLALPRRTTDACGTAAGGLPFGWVLTPLVDVREHALVRDGAARWRVEADGALRFATDADR